MPAPCHNVNAVKSGRYLDLAKRRIDKRTKLGKELVRIGDQISIDIGGDPSEAQRLLIERVVVKAALLRFSEVSMLKGESDLNDRYITLSNSLRMDLALLGLERRERNYIPAVSEYIESKKKEKSDG